MELFAFTKQIVKMETSLYITQVLKVCQLYDLK